MATQSLVKPTIPTEARAVHDGLDRDDLDRPDLERRALELEKLWDVDWEPQSPTAAPEPLPGFEQRWVRCRITGNEDVGNYLKRIKQGWLPRPVDTLPASNSMLKVRLDEKFGAKGDVIGSHDCVLMHRPIRIGDRVRAELNERNRRLRASVEQLMGTMPAEHGTAGGSIEELSVQRGTREVRIADD